MILADAMRLGSENESISASSIQKGLGATRYFGVSGPEGFDAHQAVSPALDRWVFNDGKFDLMEISGSVG